MDTFPHHHHRSTQNSSLPQPQLPGSQNVISSTTLKYDRQSKLLVKILPDWVSTQSPGYSTERQWKAPLSLSLKGIQDWGWQERTAPEKPVLQGDSQVPLGPLLIHRNQQKNFRDLVISVCQIMQSLQGRAEARKCKLWNAGMGEQWELSTEFFYVVASLVYGSFPIYVCGRFNWAKSPLPYVEQETDVPEEEERSLNGPECPSPVLAWKGMHLMHLSPGRRWVCALRGLCVPTLWARRD